MCPELEQGSPRGAPGKRPQPSSASPLPALSLGFFLCPSVCRCFSLALSPCCLCCSPSRTLSLSLSKKAESLGESSGRRGEFFVRDYFSKLAQVLTHIPLHINAVPGRNRASLLPTISREAGFTKRGGCRFQVCSRPPLALFLGSLSLGSPIGRPSNAILPVLLRGSSVVAGWEERKRGFCGYLPSSAAGTGGLSCHMTQHPCGEMGRRRPREQV